MKRALLIIDVQNYFVREKYFNLPQKIVWQIKETDYDQVYFVKFRNDPVSNFHKLLQFKDVTGSPETDLHEALVPFATPENTFEKTTYSALKNKELLQRLTDDQITHLDLCGVSLDAGVLATAYEAFDLGLAVNILENLCAVSSVRSELFTAAMEIIRRDLRPSNYRVPLE